MATLKDHQQAMVDLLASGSGIPASASRLAHAHAMHDVLGAIVNGCVDNTQHIQMLIDDATTPGLNDKALAADVEACRVKLTGAGAGPKVTPVERRVKELENTVKQLRASNASMRSELAKLRVYAEHDALPEQAGCRKDDTQLPDCWHKWVMTPLCDYEVCAKCGITPLDAFGPNKKVPLK